MSTPRLCGFASQGSSDTNQRSKGWGHTKSPPRFAISVTPTAYDRLRSLNEATDRQPCSTIGGDPRPMMAIHDPLIDGGEGCKAHGRAECLCDVHITDPVPDTYTPDQVWH